MKRKLLIVLIAGFLMLFLTGCYVCFVCPASETDHPQILETIYFCELLEHAREWAPLAEYRWMKSEWYDLTSRADIEWALDKVGWNHNYATLINLIHNLPGYQNIPFGYVKYYWGQYNNIAVVKENGKIKAFIITGGNLGQGIITGPLELRELIRDYNITEIVI